MALLALLGAACGPAATPRSLVLVSLDTVRRDHLPTYGYARDTAPAVDRLAREGVVFDNAFAQHTNTLPSHASMLTGLYPHTHGSLKNGRPLAKERSTLAEVLSDAGFRTGAFVSAAPMRAQASGLGRGFDVFDDAFERKRRDAQPTVMRAMEWLRSVAPDERFFLFVHLYDAHGPYIPRAEYAGTFRSEGPGRLLDGIPSYQLVRDPSGRPQRGLEGYVDRYDSMIRYADDQLAELLKLLDPRRTLVVVLSDHGETLGERAHILDHGGQVFDEQIRIPLVMCGPGLSTRRVETAVETVDLLPTLLELLEVPAPPRLEIQGRSLVPLLRGDVLPERPVFSSSLAIAQRHRDRGYRFRPDSQIHSVRTRDWKLMLYPTVDSDSVELYDLGNDPGERQSRDAPTADALALLEEWRASAAPVADSAEPPPLEPAARDQLRDLGYTE